MTKHINLSPSDPQWPRPEELAQQPHCDRKPTIGYLWYHAESGRRYSRGERQQRCPRCSRWYWPRWPKDAARHGFTVSAPAAASASPCLSCPAEDA